MKLEITSFGVWCFSIFRNLLKIEYPDVWFISKAISNSLISVLCDIWTPRRWSLKPRLCFVNPLLGVWICSWDETLRFVFLDEF